MAIESLLQENRLVSPSSDFISQANVSTQDLYNQAQADRLQFWATQAQNLTWQKPFSTNLS